MIGFIEGTVQWKDERTLLINVSGIGYLVYGTVELQNTATVNSFISIWTHLAVREDALDLYGFLVREELILFRLLIGISGIGPKGAMNILSIADRETLVRAVQKGDATYLTKFSGIGKKIAEKIVLELKDKLGSWEQAEEKTSAEGEALDALEALGYTPKDTRELVHNLAKEHVAAKDIIRRALQMLGGHL